LAVDDTPENIDLIKGILSDKYLIQAAVNGQMALNIVEKKKPDLILLDIQMPVMDGYEVCTILHSSHTTRDIPIIFLTAMTDSGNEMKGLSLGAVDYITKPINVAILKERVNTHLELSSSRKLLRKKNEALEEKINKRTR